MVRARSFGSIRKLASGKYQARHWRLGEQIAAEHTFAAKIDARRWLSTVEADMVRGDWVDPDSASTPTGGSRSDPSVRARSRSTKAN